MTTLPPRMIAAGLKVAYSSHRTVLSLTGERKVDVARGTSTGFAARGFSNGPNIQARGDCAPSGALAVAPRATRARELTASRATVTVACLDRVAEHCNGNRLTRRARRELGERRELLSGSSGSPAQRSSPSRNQKRRLWGRHPASLAPGACSVLPPCSACSASIGCACR